MDRAFERKRSVGLDEDVTLVGEVLEGARAVMAVGLRDGLDHAAVRQIGVAGYQIAADDGGVLQLDVGIAADRFDLAVVDLDMVENDGAEAERFQLAAGVRHVTFDVQDAALGGFHEPGIGDGVAPGIDYERFMANIGVDGAICLVMQRQIVVAGANLPEAVDRAVVDERAAIRAARNLVVAAVQLDGAGAVQEHRAVDPQVGTASPFGIDNDRAVVVDRAFERQRRIGLDENVTLVGEVLEGAGGVVAAGPAMVSITPPSRVSSVPPTMVESISTTLASQPIAAMVPSQLSTKLCSR